MTNYGNPASKPLPMVTSSKQECNSKADMEHVVCLLWCHREFCEGQTNEPKEGSSLRLLARTY